MAARLYDPTLGRFTSRDPVFGDLGTPPSLNGYAYAHLNPVTLMDPTGLCPGNEFRPDCYDPEVEQTWGNMRDNNAGSSTGCTGSNCDWEAQCPFCGKPAQPLTYVLPIPNFIGLYPSHSDGGSFHLPCTDGGTGDMFSGTPISAMGSGCNVIVGLPTEYGTIHFAFPWSLPTGDQSRRSLDRDLDEWAEAGLLRDLRISASVGSDLAGETAGSRATPSTEWGNVVQHFREHPSRWSRVSARAELAASRTYRGGISVEEVFERKLDDRILVRLASTAQTARCLTRHTGHTPSSDEWS